MDTTRYRVVFDLLATGYDPFSYWRFWLEGVLLFLVVGFILTLTRPDRSRRTDLLIGSFIAVFLLLGFFATQVLRTIAITYRVE